MTLATRCPACGTVFRVVQDQLRVSQGWVRCGRCAEAFNAVEAMVDNPPAPTANRGIEAPLPVHAPNPDWQSFSSASPASPANPEFVTPLEPVTDALPATPPASALIELPPGVEVVASDGALSRDALLPAPGTRTEPGFDLHNDIFIGPPEAPPRVQPSTAADPGIALPPPLPPVPVELALQPDPAAPSPSFVTQAERAARWRRPGVRIALALACLLSALGLAAQAAYAFRDRMAASSPGARQALQRACAALGCRVGDYRQIDALTVESSGLTRVEGAPVYRLSVTLRNRAAVEVAAPALDLSLTDAQGRAIARRVLHMSDLNLPLRTLKAGSELPIQVPLGIGDRQVSGYTVEIFYP